MRLLIIIFIVSVASASIAHPSLMIGRDNFDWIENAVLNQYGENQTGETYTGFDFSEDCTSMIMADNHNGHIDYFDTEDCNPFFAVADTSKDADLSTDTVDPSDVEFVSSNTRMIVLDKGENPNTPEILTYDLSSAKDPSTSSKVTSCTFDLNGISDEPTDIEFVSAREFHMIAFASSALRVFNSDSDWCPGDNPVEDLNKTGNLADSGLNQHRGMDYASSGTLLFVVGENQEDVVSYEMEAFNPSTMTRKELYFKSASGTFIADIYIDETNKRMVYQDVNGTGTKVISSAPHRGPITGLQIDFNHTSAWVGVNGISIVDMALGEEFSLEGLTYVAGSPGNDFTTITAGEFTTDSDFNTAAILDDGGSASVHWSDSSSSSLNFYAAFEWGLTLKNIDIWNHNPATYGIWSGITFKDQHGNTIIPVDSPDDIDDFIDSSGTKRLYRWVF